MCEILSIASISNEKIEIMSIFSVFKFINLSKNLNHAANRICTNLHGNIFAVRCNCSRKTYHPMIGGHVYWNEKIPAKNIVCLKKLPIEKIFQILED